MTALTAVCVGCRRLRRLRTRRECGTCYTARYRPRTGNPGGAGTPKTRADVAGRIEDLAQLLREETRREVIAARLGVSSRTVSRYLTRLERST